MNGTEKNFIIGVNYFVTLIESFTIKNLVIFYKLLKKYSISALLHLKNFLEYVFNKQNRKISVLTIILTILIVKIIQIIKNLINTFKRKKLEIGIKKLNKDHDNSVIESDSINFNEKLYINNSDLSEILVSYTIDFENNKKNLLKDNIQKIKKAVDIQNKIRDKLNLPKENINTPFYSILKLYINDSLNKN